MWGIFAHVNLSRVLGQKGQLWPRSLTSSLIQNNFIIFFPQSPLSFPFKKKLSDPHSTRAIGDFDIPLLRAVPAEEAEAGVQIHCP